MKKHISIFLTVVLLLSSTCFGSLAEENTVTYKTGALPVSQEDILSIMDTNVYSSNVYSSLPSAVDNTSKFPTPGDQGTQQSCVAWAVGYALKSNSEYLKRGWTISNEIHHFSPSYIYNQINDGEDAGADILTALNLIRNEGVCTLAYMDYDESDYTTQPNAIQTANAALYKAKTFYLTTDIKNQIAQGNGVIVCIKVYPDLKNLSSTNQIYDSTAGTAESLGHAICLIGYDDSKNAYKFINSWGTSWGLGGYGWISYNLVNSATVNELVAGTGLCISFESTDSYLMGDIDGDGNILAADSRLALSYAVQETDLTASQAALADVNGDAVVNAADSREILRYATGIITQFSLYD